MPILIFKSTVYYHAHYFIFYILYFVLYIFLFFIHLILCILLCVVVFYNICTVHGADLTHISLLVNTLSIIVYNVTNKNLELELEKGSVQTVAIILEAHNFPRISLYA